MGRRQKMRDPDRIPIILDKLRNLWQKYPDLRLGQLITMFFGNKDIFYIEDDKVLELFEIYCDCCNNHPCKGECGCQKCHDGYMDFLSEE